MGSLRFYNLTDLTHSYIEMIKNNREDLRFYSEHIQGGCTLNKKEFIVLIGILLVLLLGSTVSAINGKSNLATLRGLTGVGVLIEQLPVEVEKEGLLRKQIQIEVEFKLRDAGIRVLTREECLKTPGEPYLYINMNVNTSKTESDIYPYSIDIVLMQKVSLVRDPKQTTYAVTWSVGGVGSISKGLLIQLRESVNDALDIFIKAYLNENRGK